MRRKFWQAVFVGILIVGIYAFLPTSGIAIAEQWLEAMLGRLR